MLKRCFLLLLVLSAHLAFPAFAATPYTGSNYDAKVGFTATLTASGDTIAVPLAGGTWANAAWTVSIAGSGGITTEYTTEAAGVNAVNWLPTPYSVRTDVATATRSIAPWANNTPIVATFETPLPGNCTAFRIRYQTGGTPTTITLSGGAPYVPANPVVATLIRQTAVFGVSMASGQLDLSGWSAAFIATFNADTGGVSRSATLNLRRDDGTQVQQLFADTVTSGTAIVRNLSRAFGSATTAAGMLPPRYCDFGVSAGTGTGGSAEYTFWVSR